MAGQEDRDLRRQSADSDASPWVADELVDTNVRDLRQPTQDLCYSLTGCMLPEASAMWSLVMTPAFQNQEEGTCVAPRRFAEIQDLIGCVKNIHRLVYDALNQQGIYQVTNRFKASILAKLRLQPGQVYGRSPVCNLWCPSMSHSQGGRYV